jgi:peptidoglycan/LPS O-acetylase OafA/YrhL
MIPTLTAIRGLAAWWVVFFHFKEEIPGIDGTSLYQLMSHGYLAVDLFFELSGFVIALNYTSILKRPRLKNITNFLIMRLARIYPLYILILVAYTSIPISIKIFSSKSDISGHYGIAYFLLSALLIQNWGFVANIDWNVPAWSLSTEWGAYLVFPAIAWVSSNITISCIRSATMIMILMSLITTIYLISGDTLGGDIPHLGLIRCVTEFGIGVFLYKYWKERGSMIRYEGDITSLLVLLLIMLYLTKECQDFAIFPLAFCLLIYALLDKTSWLSRMLTNSWLEWIGTTSYSTYMIHYFVKEWVKLLLIREGIPVWTATLFYVGVIALASEFLYKWIELPGRKLMRARLLLE